MAITQVRVKLGNTWTTLTYNAATGRYEASLTAPGTSIDQPGGYYSLTAEAANSTGDTASITGTQLPSLRLTVRETDAPSLTLSSPPAGYVTTSSPLIVFRCSDPPGGSGIDTGSGEASIDGVSVPCAVSPAGTGYQLAIQAEGLSEGPHTVTAAISDRDGNRTTASAAYIVDTVPPGLTILRPYLRHVVDGASVVISGQAVDSVSANVSVTVGGQAVTPEEDGTFSVDFPLLVGVNSIQVSAADAAGNQTAAQVTLIRLVTDRTQADADKVADMCARGYARWTEEERAWWASALCLRGSYDDRDLDRVGMAVALLTEELAMRGVSVSTSPKTDWTETDTPVKSQMAVYRNNVAAIRDSQDVESMSAMPLPDSMEKLDLTGANQLERVLVAADALFPNYSAWTSGEITCGGG